MEKFNLLFNSPSDWTMFGELKSQERAREMFPMLVARASERKTMSFGEFAKHFNIAFALPIKYPVVCTTGTLYKLERNQLPNHPWKHGMIPRIAISYGDEIKRRACGFRCHAVATSRTSSGF